MSDEEQKQQFAIMIADIIQELLQDSDELSEILETASDEGYDIFLTVFSGIMIRRRDEDDVEAEDTAPGPLPIKFEFTEMDKEFLQSIGVRIPAEEGREEPPGASDSEL
ncbi:MAG: hypothetical protein GY801_45930 [bacterium]|nr:hypothetical protein [bacterium]